MRAFVLLFLTVALSSAVACKKGKDTPDGTVGMDATTDGDVCPTVTFPSVTTTNLTGDGSSPFVEPVFATGIPGTTDIAVVERLGTIRIVRGGAVLPTAFLTLTATDLIDGTNVNDGNTGEQGLLGLAFHPDYETNGRFFIAYTHGSDPGGNARRNIVAEWSRDPADHDVALGEVHRLVEVVDPQTNHNGGMLEFGPDGLLYASIGDGGSGGDQGSGHNPTTGNGLDRNTLLGKILRLDVDASGNEYAAAGNPFSPPTGLTQIYTYGLRNPWRFSIDDVTQTLYIGDVGQDTTEEIDALPLASANGANFGWAAYEGSSPTTFYTGAAIDALAANRTDPVLDLPQSNSLIGNIDGVVGGYVYRGSAVPGLAGWYLFGSIGGQVGAFRLCGGQATNALRVTTLSGRAGAITSFAEDGAGELYIVDGGGRLLQIVAD